MDSKRNHHNNLPAWTEAPRPPRAGTVPGWAIWVGAIAGLTAALPLALAARARVSTSAQPRIQLVQDMAYQPRYGPQAPAPAAVFEDGRAMRPKIADTAARGRLDGDDHYYRGFAPLPDGAPAGAEPAWYDTFPDRVKVDASLLARGQQRFGIYCAVCHGQDGYGNGPVNVRAKELAAQGLANWVEPANLHADAVRSRPVGHIYNTINMGIRNMPAYGPQIPVEDRWAIVAYVRALQLSQYAPADYVPAGKLPEAKK